MADFAAVAAPPVDRTDKGTCAHVDVFDFPFVRGEAGWDGKWCRSCGALCINPNNDWEKPIAQPVNYPQSDEVTAILAWVERSIVFWGEPGRLPLPGRLAATGAMRGLLRELQAGDHRASAALPTATPQTYGITRPDGGRQELLRAAEEYADFPSSAECEKDLLNTAETYARTQTQQEIASWLRAKAERLIPIMRDELVSAADAIDMGKWRPQPTDTPKKRTVPNE